MAEVDVGCVEEFADIPQKTYEEKCQYMSAIAQPLATEKLCKRLFKLCRRSKRAKQIDVSIKSIVKNIEKKGVSGIVVIAGDTHPIDLISHIPLVCEEHNVPYCYIPSKFDLGTSIGSTAPVSIALITRDDAYGELYDKCYNIVDSLPLPI